MNRYLARQISAGADVVQIFDTWSGILSADQFQTWAAPAARQVASGLSVPAIYFVPGASHLVELLPTVGASGYGVDWRQPLSEVRRRMGAEVVLQGNLDPAVLLTSPQTVREATIEVLKEAGGGNHIFNLGHGVLPGTSPENVAAAVEAVCGWSK
jgi:uroporphyrinogen decarboxylase